MSKYQQRIVEKDNKFVVQYRRLGLFADWQDFPAKFATEQEAKKYQNYGILVKLSDEESTKFVMKI